MCDLSCVSDYFMIGVSSVSCIDAKNYNILSMNVSFDEHVVSFFLCLYIH